MRAGRRRWLATMVAVATTVATAASVAAALDPESAPAAHHRSAKVASRTSPASRQQTVHRTRLLGRSAQHRPIVLTETGTAGRSTILVVGCVHGNEPAGIAVARDLVTDPTPGRVLLWVVPDLNPDGVAAGARQNARGVDLNRNFPWRWRPLARPGSLYYSGPHALSELESRMAHRLILRRRPDVAIWFHQHEDVVDESGGDVRIERRYAALTHMPIARLPRFPGSAVGWQNHALPGTTAFVVELPAGSLGPQGVERFSDAILRLMP